MAAFWEDKLARPKKVEAHEEPEEPEAAPTRVDEDDKFQPPPLPQEKTEIPLVHAAASLVGGRSSMEDFNDAYVPAMSQRQAYSILAVYDGHAGPKCSKFLKENLIPTLRQGLEEGQVAESPEEFIASHFAQLDEAFCVKAREKNWHDGSSALVVLVRRDEESGIAKKAWFANAGDSRAIIVRKSGKVKQMNRELTPYLEDELKRVQQEGGFIKFVQNPFAPAGEGTMRVSGVLAMTRAFGNYSLKPFVTASPEITSRNLRKDDIYICLASDGLWETVTNEEAGEYLLKFGAVTGCERLASLALQRGSMDNITVMAMRLNANVNDDHLPF